MRKYFFTAAVLLGCSMPARAWTKIVKENGGFFGYKTVTEQVTPGSSQLVCSNPGHTKCKFSPIVTVDPDGTTLSEDQLDDIDSWVEGRLVNREASGNFLYSDAFYVKYTYDPETDKLEIEIYSLDEARDLGLI
jgi:hypothetical protein